MTNVNMIDLDDFVVGWASQLGKSKGLNSSQKVTHTIDWSRVNVATEKPSYSSAVASAPHSVTLFKSRFENKSSGEQEHTFSAESKYTSSTSVSLHQCFTLDGRTKVDLSLPGQVLDATSAFGQKLSVISASTQMSEKEQSWNVNTKIAVPAGETITAQQTVQEIKYSAQFSVVTVISGKVHVIRRLPEGSEVFMEPKNIAEIVRLFQGSLPSFVQTDGRTIRITNTGTCELTYGVEQYVTVSNCDDADHWNHNEQRSENSCHLS